MYSAINLICVKPPITYGKFRINIRSNHPSRRLDSAFAKFNHKRLYLEHTPPEVQILGNKPAEVRGGKSDTNEKNSCKNLILIIVR